MSQDRFDDPIVAEIHKTREKLLAECDGDIEEADGPLGVPRERRSISRTVGSPSGEGLSSAPLRPLRA